MGQIHAISNDGSNVYLCDSQNSSVIVTDTEIGIDATPSINGRLWQPSAYHTLA